MATKKTLPGDGMPEPAFLLHLRSLLPYRSTFDTALLRRFIRDVYDDQVYVIGDEQSAFGLFNDPDRGVVGMFHAGHDALSKNAPSTLLVSGRVNMIEPDWETIRAIIRGCFHESLTEDAVDPDSVVVPINVHASVVLSLIPNGWETTFLLHRRLTQTQGFALLQRAAIKHHHDPESLSVFPQCYLH